MEQQGDEASDKRIIDTLKRQIEIFKTTGKLPREHDVVAGRYASDDPSLEEINFDNLPNSEPFESEDASIFKEVATVFQQSLTQMEDAVYNLNMVGGMTQEETAQCLNISQPRVYQLILAIRAKCQEHIERYKKDDEEERRGL